MHEHIQKTTQLMYAASDDLVNRSQLALVPTPPPMGSSHAPYPFAQYVDDVTAGLQSYGHTIEAEEFVVTADQQQFFGMMEITSDRVQSNGVHTINVGLRGSHNQTLPRGLLLGTRVIVCSNLCFHGNIGQFKTKQTVNLVRRLPELIFNALGMIPDMVTEQDEIFDRFKNHKFKPRWGDAALVSMYREGAFSSPQLTRAINEWHEPSYEEHAAGGWNLWRLFNASTEAIKPTGQGVNMATVEQRTMKVSNYLTALAA